MDGGGTNRSLCPIHLNERRSADPTGSDGSGPNSGLAAAGDRRRAQTLENADDRAVPFPF